MTVKKPELAEKSVFSKVELCCCWHEKGSKACVTTGRILLLFVASLSHAQEATPSEREMIQQLVQQVTVLEEKVKVLESQQRTTGFRGR